MSGQQLDRQLKVGGVTGKCPVECPQGRT
jgi:hypothetical protein